MNPDGFAALAALLGPSLSVDRFLGEYWDMRSVYIPPHDGERPPPHGRAFGGVLALEDMDDLLIRVQLPSSKAELLLFEDLREATGSYATPHAAFASGASIIVNHADKVWPRINELCARLGAAFRYTFCNLYFTPHASQTAPPHSDDRDVLILQVHGRKRWRVWPTPHERATRRPFADEQAGKEARAPPIDPRELGAPELDVVLDAGALLYIPRGALHVADTASADTDCSLHLTIAIPTADLSVGGYVIHAAKAHVFGRRGFRKALPLGALPAQGDAAAEAAWQAEHARLWAAAHDAVGLAEASGELSDRMAVHRRAQRDALAAVVADMGEADAQRVVTERGLPVTLALRPSTLLRKTVPLQLIKPHADAGDARVAQSMPEPGGPGRKAYIHTPPEFLRPLETFAALPVGASFRLRELDARHEFMQACAMRALLGLGVAIPLVAPSDHTE